MHTHTYISTVKIFKFMSSNPCRRYTNKNLVVDIISALFSSILLKKKTKNTNKNRENNLKKKRV